MFKINILNIYERIGARSAAVFARQVLPRPVNIAAVALVASIAGGGAASGTDLAPHTAYYALSLLTSGGTSDLESVGGDMALKWSAGCSGWTVDNYMTMDVGYADRDPIRFRTEATAWEASDGSRYNFSLRTLINGREMPKVEGHAISDGDRSVAVFSAPERRVVPLPDNIQFPFAHTRKIVSAAAQGLTVVSLPMFDGFASQKPQIVNVVIGKRVASPARAGSPAKMLKDVPAWNFGFAMFGDETTGAGPEMEGGSLIYANGVTERFDMSVAEFVVRAQLKKLALDAMPDCGK